MGDVVWMVAVMAVQAIVTAIICALLEKKCVCIDQSNKNNQNEEG